MASQQGLSTEAFNSAVEKARSFAEKFVQSSKRPHEGSEPPMPEVKRPVIPQNDEEKTYDMHLPGTKVGYVIGKGGEMIRQLQERAQVKMVVIQQTAEVTSEQKILRIMGTSSKIDNAIQMVNDLLHEKEMEAMKMKKFANVNEYGTKSGSSIDITVPPQFIGLVIGKGGETIKRIQQETGAKVQFDTTKSDHNGNKICTVHGNPDAVNRAANMIREVLDGNNKKQNMNSGGGNSSSFGAAEVEFSVPANRTGIVIGKGGDTIRAIKQQSGCDIELVKDSKGIFKIRGTPERIQYAKQLINEKVHGTGSTISSPTQPNSPTFTEQQNYWSNYWQNESQLSNASSSNEGSSTSQDANAAAWAAYYAQYYAQAQQQQVQTTTAIPTSYNPGTVDTQSDLSQHQQQNPGAQGGDYSAQWAEYYRAFGMHKEAEMIEQMAKNSKQGVNGPESGQSSNNYNSNPDHNENQTTTSTSTPIAYPGYYAMYSQSGSNQHSSDKQ